MLLRYTTSYTNLWCPGLLAYRIWKIECSVCKTRATGSSSTPVLRVLVDAALLYSVALLAALLCFAFSNNGQFVMIDIVSPLLHAVEQSLRFAQSDRANHLNCLLHDSYSRLNERAPGLSFSWKINQWYGARKPATTRYEAFAGPCIPFHAERYYRSAPCHWHGIRYPSNDILQCVMISFCRAGIQHSMLQFESVSINF